MADEPGAALVAMVRYTSATTPAVRRCSEFRSALDEVARRHGVLTAAWLEGRSPSSVVIGAVERMEALAAGKGCPGNGGGGASASLESKGPGPDATVDRRQGGIRGQADGQGTTELSRDGGPQLCPG